MSSRYVYLIDSNGQTLHEWMFENPGSNAYLLPDGSLMRSEQVPEGDAFDLRGQAGRIQHVDWDGNVLWEFKYASETRLQHHDYERLPNGNVLLIACEKKTRESRELWHSRSVTSPRRPELCQNATPIGSR